VNKIRGCFAGRCGGAPNEAVPQYAGERHQRNDGRKTMGNHMNHFLLYDNEPFSAPQTIQKSRTMFSRWDVVKPYAAMKEAFIGVYQWAISVSRFPVTNFTRARDNARKREYERYDRRRIKGNHSLLGWPIDENDESWGRESFSVWLAWSSGSIFQSV
jgi:hypothetical protein